MPYHYLKRPYLSYLILSIINFIFLINWPNEEQLNLIKYPPNNLGPGLIKKLYESGINTIRKISLVKKEELLELEGIKERSANKLVSNIRKIIDAI